jgi:hypothetical protein
MTTTNTLFAHSFAALALAGALFAAGPAAAGLSGHVDRVASTETTNTGAQDVAETTATAEPRVADAADRASAERSPRRDSDVTARRHTQSKAAAPRQVERSESRKPRSTWHAVSYASATPIGFGLPCHRR